MNKKIFLLSLSLCFISVLSGCSFFPRKPSSSDTKAFAKMYINDKVEPAGTKYSERNGYGKTYYYPMVDERGIEFDVIVNNSKESLVEAYIPFLYSKYLTYTTNYKYRILEYYSKEIEEMLKAADIVDYKLDKYSIHIQINEDASLEEVATLIIAIDELVDFDYRYNAFNNESLGNNQFWKCGISYDIIIEQQDSNGKLLLFESFLFSNNNSIELTHDNVRKILELDQISTTSGTRINIVRVNGEFYYDSGEVTQAEKTGEMDGTTTGIYNELPKKDNQANFGGNIEYQFAPDGTLYVFMSDGRHIFLKYE